MNKIAVFMAIGVFAIALVTGCQNAPAPQVSKTPTATPDLHTAADDAPRISVADAKKEFDAGTAVFVDTRAEAQFKSERIAGAISMPADTVEDKYSTLPSGKKIIAYCS